MKGLNALERRTLEPVGAPGDFAPDAVLDELIRDGRAYWKCEGIDSFFYPTELGFLALRVCPREGT